MCDTEDWRILEPAAAPVEFMGAMTKDYANGFRGRPSWLANNNTFHYSAWQVHGWSDFSSATPAYLPKDYPVHPDLITSSILELLRKVVYVSLSHYFFFICSASVTCDAKLIRDEKLYHVTTCGLARAEKVFISCSLLRSGVWIVKSVCLLLCYFANRDDNRAPVMTIASSHSHSSFSVPDPNHHHHHYRQSLAQSHHTPVTYDGIVILLLLLVTCRPSKWNC